MFYATQQVAWLLESDLAGIEFACWCQIDKTCPTLFYWFGVLR